MPIVINPEQDNEDSGVMGDGSQNNQEPTNISGAESSTVQSDSPSAGNQTQKKQKGSGFTNVQKYTEANQGAAQKIAGAATGNIQNQANAIGQQVQKQRQSFTDQVNQNRQRIQSAQQFGQQAIQKASSAIDQGDIQKQQDELNARIAQTQSAPTQDYQSSIQQTQQDLNKANEAYNIAEQNRNKAISDINKQQDLANQYKAAASEPIQVSGPNINTYSTPNYRAQQDYEQAQINLNNQVANRESLDQPVYQNLQQKQAAEQQLEQLNYNQRLAARRDLLQTELSNLQQKAAANIPLTEDEVTRFRNILTEKEVYDNIAYNDLGSENKAQQLSAQTAKLGSEQGRRELLRQTFSSVPSREYTRGQSALDQLLLQTDRPVAEQFITQGKQLGLSALEQAQEARRQSLREMAGLSTDASNLRSGLQSGVTKSQEDLTKQLDTTQLSGEGSYLAKLKQAYDQGLLSQDQAKTLGLNNGQAYGVNIGSKLADYKDLATRESIASKSDLAKASQLAKLAGQPEQTIFANPNLIGQMSEAEKARINEIQGSIYDAKKLYEGNEANLLAAQNNALGEGTNWGGFDQATADRSAGLISSATQAAKDGQISREELIALMNSPQAKGIGDLSRYTGANKNLIDLQNQMLQNRLQVEGSTDALTARQRQVASNQEQQRRDILNAIGAASSDYVNTLGGKELGTLSKAQVDQINRQNALMKSANPNAVINQQPMPKSNLIEAYNRITGRNLIPEV